MVYQKTSIDKWYITWERKDAWSPAISTPLIELERDNVGVLETVSIVDKVNDLRSFEKYNS